MLFVAYWASEYQPPNIANERASDCTIVIINGRQLGKKSDMLEVKISYYTL